MIVNLGDAYGNRMPQSEYETLFGGQTLLTFKLFEDILSMYEAWRCWSSMLLATQVTVDLSIDPHAQQKNYQIMLQVMVLIALCFEPWLLWQMFGQSRSVQPWHGGSNFTTFLEIWSVEVLTPNTWRPTWRWYTTQCLGWTNQWVKGHKNGFSTFVNSQLKGPSCMITKLDLLWIFFVIHIVEIMV